MSHGSVMTEYIVHADDFGYSDDVNACIDQCIKKAWVSETSLMVNMPACEDAVRMAVEHGYIDKVGIHLNLTEGVPLTNPIKNLPNFCDGSGRFNKKFHLSTLKRFFLSSREKFAVEMELSAQFERFLGYGGVMRRIDSHHHVHTNWAIYRLILPLARKYGFTAMRISADMHKVRFDKEIYKRLFNADVRRSFATTDHFDGIVDGILTPNDSTVEVMVHPLIWNGCLCDSHKDFVYNITKVMSVENSFIRKALWKSFA